MRRLLIATIPALVVALAVAAMLPPNVLYPARCETYPTLYGVPIHPGEFCISYDPALGRYELPPPDVPADIARFATATANPDLVRFTVGSVVFVVVLIGTWGAALFLSRLRRGDYRA